MPQSEDSNLVLTFSKCPHFDGVKLVLVLALNASSNAHQSDTLNHFVECYGKNIFRSWCVISTFKSIWFPVGSDVSAILQFLCMRACRYISIAHVCVCQGNLRGNQVPLCKRYGAPAKLLFMYWSKLYLQIWCDQLARSARIIITAWFTARQSLCAHDIVRAGKATHTYSGLSYEKIRRYNNSASYVTSRWPPQRIPLLNFLGVCALMDWFMCEY